MFGCPSSSFVSESMAVSLFFFCIRIHGRVSLFFVSGGPWPCLVFVLMAVLMAFVEGTAFLVVSKNKATRKPHLSRCLLGPLKRLGDLGATIC